MILKQEGWLVSKTRGYRLYRLESLQLRMKVKRRKRVTPLRGKPQKPTGPNQDWSMDFVHDQIHDGRTFHILTIIDQWSRKSEWAYRRGIKLAYTRPGKPMDNGLIESFNRRLRNKFLNVNEFVTLHDAREKLKVWQDDYNHHRPHSSLGSLTPNEFVSSRSVQPNEAASL